MRHPHVLQLIMDSLRYWVPEMHVDGFRFDLAADARPRAARRRPALGLLRPHPAGPRRQPGEADRRAVGRRRGRLPGRQLPAAVVGVERQVPRHACATSGAASDADARRVRLPPHRQLATSTQATGRRPYASINFVTAHDGFTLRDLVSLQRQAQRGQRRGQPRRRATTTARGTAAPRARPTTPRSTRCARRQQRNFLATLLLSQGVPMLLGGDEIGRTQQRQQQRLLPGQRDLLVRLGARRRRACSSSRARLIALRREHPVFRRRRWFQGRPIHGARRRPTSAGSRPTARR